MSLITKDHLSLTLKALKKLLEQIENARPTETTPDLTGLATEDFVTQQIANLVNSAPDALNTLDELAAALGDDENFATTVTNQIATKADAVHAHSWSEIKDNPFDDVVAKDLTLLESGECTVTKFENFLINSYCDTIVCTCDDVEYTFDVVFNDGCYYWGYDEFQAGTSPIYFWSNVTLDGGEIRVVDDGQPHAVTYSTYRVTEVYNPIDSKFIGNDIARVEDIPDITAPRDEFILNSSTEGSTKQFKITIDDTGTLTVSEIV